jgi:queuine tRNA-ribosyltransferase
MNYSRPIFSDSGGFQIMSLPDAKINGDGVHFKSHLNGDKLEMTPESSMQAQWTIGADIHMCFDCPVGYGDTKTDASEYTKAARAMQTTHDWAGRCLTEHTQIAATVKNGTYSNYQALFGVIQGGKFTDLRDESARFFADKDFDGYAIGGMYTADEGTRFLPSINKILPENKPRHWLGMGAEPRDFFVGIENGIDTFDCVAPTRQARNGALYTHHGRINIRGSKYRELFEPIDTQCDCPVCKNHTSGYIHHLFRADEMTGKILATVHNEYFVVNLVNQIRQSIIDENFSEFKQKFLADYYGE